MMLVRVSGHAQRSALLALLEIGVGGVTQIAEQSGVSKSSLHGALIWLEANYLIAEAPDAMRNPDLRNGCAQYGLTESGISNALYIESMQGVNA